MKHDSNSLRQLSGIELRLSYQGPPVIEGLTIDLPIGQITVIVGPNGCGKSTLLRAFARVLIPDDGKVILHGEQIRNMPTRDVARELGLLPQNQRSPDSIVVKDLIRRGRYPHQRLFDQWSKKDQDAVNKALEITGLENFSERPVDELSGGQRQRVWIAMVLAQDTPIMLLDEPTTHLDMAHQIEILELLNKLSAEEKRTVVMVLHDINLAARYAANLVAMRDGSVICSGCPNEIVTSEMVQSVFNVQAVVISDPVTDSPLVIPHPRQKTSKKIG